MTFRNCLMILIAVVGFVSVSARTPQEILLPQLEYAVPAPTELEPYAVFPMPEYSVRQRNGWLKVEYPLPPELVGEQLEIEFQGPAKARADGLLHLSGPLGVMTCKNGECAVEYRNLNIDPVRVEAFLRSVSRSEGELKARLHVAGDFLVDPRGIIRPRR